MHIRLVPVALLLLCITACSEPSDPASDGGMVGVDAYVPPPIDAGQPDAGPPVCVGTPSPCEGRSGDACDDGCYQRACSGSPRPCERYFDAADCRARQGCDWYSDECEGYPLVCSGNVDETSCRRNNCTWSSDAPCMGTAVRCESLDERECDLASGCRRASVEVDGGTMSDAATDDAGDASVDGGRSCPSTGCHALYDAACGCGYSETTFDWACGRSGTSALGGACDTPADCGPGLYCGRRTNAARGQCRRLCDEDSDCGAGEGCAMTAEVAVSCSGLCLPLAECDVDAQNCSSGRGCYWYTDAETARQHQFCNTAGTGAENANCYGDPTACQRGFVCAGLISLRCSRVCTSDTDCTRAGTTCTGTTEAGDTYCAL